MKREEEEEEEEEEDLDTYYQTHIAAHHPDRPQTKYYNFNFKLLFI